MEERERGERIGDGIVCCMSIAGMIDHVATAEKAPDGVAVSSIHLHPANEVMAGSLERDLVVWTRLSGGRIGKDPQILSQIPLWGIDDQRVQVLGISGFEVATSRRHPDIERPLLAVFVDDSDISRKPFATVEYLGRGSRPIQRPSRKLSLQRLGPLELRPRVVGTNRYRAGE